MYWRDCAPPSGELFTLIHVDGACSPPLGCLVAIRPTTVGLYLQWCLFFTGSPLWQQVTNIAAVMAHCGISPNRYVRLSKLELMTNSFCNMREICLLYGHTLGRRLGSAAQLPSHFVGSVYIDCLLLRARSACGSLSQ
jgi:hypothetical protein